MIPPQTLPPVDEGGYGATPVPVGPRGAEVTKTICPLPDNGGDSASHVINLPAAQPREGSLEQSRLLHLRPLLPLRSDGRPFRPPVGFSFFLAWLLVISMWGGYRIYARATGLNVSAPAGTDIHRCLPFDSHQHGRDFRHSPIRPRSHAELRRWSGLRENHRTDGRPRRSGDCGATARKAR